MQTRKILTVGLSLGVLLGGLSAQAANVAPDETARVRLTAAVDHSEDKTGPALAAWSVIRVGSDQATDAGEATKAKAAPRFVDDSVTSSAPASPSMPAVSPDSSAPDSSAPAALPDSSVAPPSSSDGSDSDDSDSDDMDGSDD